MSEYDNILKELEVKINELDKYIKSGVALKLKCLDRALRLDTNNSYDILTAAKEFYEWVK